MRNFFIGLSTGSFFVGGFGLLLGLALGFGLGYLAGQWAMTGKVVSQDPSSGRFLSEPKTVWMQDGRSMQLIEDFVFIDSRGQPWLAEKDTVVNGASIPEALWSVIGSPFTGKYRNASIVHDAECEKMQVPAADVHRMFYDACLAGGVSETEAKALYWAVANHGPQWRLLPVYESASSNGQEKTTTVLVPETTQPKPLSPGELEWAMEYISKYDPPIEAIPDIRSP